MRFLLIAAAAIGIGLFGGVGADKAEASNGSIVDYLYAKGEDHSFAHRKQLAAQKGISPYSGTASQNIRLLNSLKSGSAAIPSKSVQTKAKKTTKAVSSSSVKGKKLKVNASAYTAYCKGCSGITATGINLRANPGKKVIAVDPKVIPLGSTVYVEGYGTAIAGDTGGAIKGNKIDIFMPSKQQALNFGRRNITVTVIK